MPLTKIDYTCTMFIKYFRVSYLFLLVNLKRATVNHTYLFRTFHTLGTFA